MAREPGSPGWCEAIDQRHEAPNAHAAGQARTPGGRLASVGPWRGRETCECGGMVVVVVVMAAAAAAMCVWRWLGWES